MKEKALELAAEGYYVFPIRAMGKQPAIKKWQEKATTDPTTIEKWWSGQHYDRNIGISTEASNLVVIDIDTKSEDGRANYAKLLDKHGANDTLTITTPTGGAHLYYTVPDGTSLKSTVGKLTAGVDTRALGGYVVAEGSVTNQGKYERVIDFSVAPCPKWLIPLLTGVKSTPTGQKEGLCLDLPVDCASAIEYLKGVSPAIQGQGGDHQTYAICCRLHDMGISIDKGVELLAEHWNEECQPPWPPEMLRQKMSNAYDFAQSEPGCQSRDMGAIESSPKRVHCVADMNLDIPPRDWLLEGRLIAGYVSVIVAPGGEGKSMYSMLEAISVATGKPLTGIKPMKRGPVLIYNTEDPQDEIERRLAAICIQYDIDPKSLDNVFYASGADSPLRFAISDRKGVVLTKDKEVLQEIIKENNIILTVIDPFVRSHSVDENSNVEIDLVVQQMSTLAMATSSAISVVHHTFKSKQHEHGSAHASRGASALSDAARVVSTILSPSEEDAEDFGIPPGQHKRYLRLDGAKGNMTAPNQKAQWFTKESVTLPNGDSVGVIKSVDIWSKQTPEMGAIVEPAAKEVLEIMAPWLGIGEIKTEEFADVLAEQVEEQFYGLSLEAAIAKWDRMFADGVGNGTYRITTKDGLTNIEASMPWD
jgi:hypothetical protein